MFTKLACGPLKFPIKINRNFDSSDPLRAIKVSKVATIRKRYNQAPHPTQDTNGKATNSQKTAQTRAKRPAPSQQVTTKHTHTDAHKTQQTQDRTKTQKIHKRSTALERSVKHPTGGSKPAQRRQPHP